MKKGFKYILIVLAVMMLLGTGIGTIVDASFLPSQRRTVNGPGHQMETNTTAAQASRRVGYHYDYSRQGWVGRLPRTRLTIDTSHRGVLIAAGQFSGHVNCLNGCAIPT